MNTFTRSRATRPLLLGCLTLALLCSACSRKDSAQLQPVPVRVVTVQPTTLAEPTRYSATVSALSQVALSFRSGGYVETIGTRPGPLAQARTLETGDTVARGELLAAVRQRDTLDKLAQAEGQLAQAQATFDKADADFTRATHLLASGSLTQVNFDAAKAAHDSSEAALKGARALVSEARTAVEDSSLRAPFDGVIVQRNIERGALVGPATPAFVVADISSVKVVFGVTDSVVGRLKVGEPVELRTNSLPGALEGRIASISPSADPRTRLFPIEILLPNAERRIKPGFLATIFLPDEEQGGVLCLPLGSVMKGAGADSPYVVFTIEKQGERTVARERRVKLGEIAGNQIIILEGLRAGEAVVTLGATHLKEGSPVLLVP